jgi:hypothetical protein
MTSHEKEGEHEMQTQHGMLARMIHEDRVRACSAPARLHAVEAQRTAARPGGPRALFGRWIGRVAARVPAETVVAPTRP